MEQPEGIDIDDVFEKYQTRRGTNDPGRLYEVKVAALLLLRCANTRDMCMASNADEIGDFDDVVLFKKTTEGQYIAYMVQLKHQGDPKNIKPSDFTEKKDFKLSKYSTSFDKLKKKIENPTEKEGKIIKYLRAAHKSFFVLYTNKGVNNCECKFLKDCYDDDLLTLTTSDRYYSFDYTQLGDYNRDFLNQLILLPNQASVDGMDGIIRNEIKQLMHSLLLTHKDISNISNKFVDFITNWAQSNLRKQYFLTKRDIHNKLASLLLNRYRIDLSTPNFISLDSPQTCIFNEIVTDKVITILDADNKVFEFLMQYVYSEVVKHSNEDVENYKNNLSQQSKQVFYQNCTKLKTQMIKILGNPQDITFLDVYTCMWLDNQLPLLLKIETQQEYETIPQILELFGFNIRVVLLNKTAQPLPKIDTILKCFETLEDLDEVYRDALLNRHVKLQGRSLVLLSRLVDNSMFQYITSNHIIYILSNDFCIGNVYEPPFVYFIERSFYRVLIDPEVMKNINNELFLIENPSRLNYNFLHIDESKICNLDDIDEADFNITSVISAERHEGLENIQKIIHASSGKPIHWLKIDNAHNLEWKRSLGSTSNVKSYQLYNETITYTVEEICQQSPTHLLSASPGMGKSTLMDCLAHRAPQNMWILNINLNQHKMYYISEECRNSNTSVLTHLKYFNAKILEKHNCSSQLANAVFQKFLDAKRILILLDGFDEISVLHKHEVTNIAKCLQQEGYQIWLTTRPFVKFYLEEELNSISMTLKPFTQDDQKTFLIKYFTEIHSADITDEKSHHIIERLVKELLEAAAKNLYDKSYQFMGIPLQTKLLADAFRDECLESINANTIQFNKNFDLLDLYEKFITVITDILYKKYSWQEIHLINIIANYKEIQLFCALKILFDDDHLQNLDIEAKITNFKIVLKEGAQFLLRDGIMVTENEFVHRSFAEYICAKWLAENFNSQDDQVRNTIVILLNVRFNYQHQFLFNIFDRIVSNNYPTHLAIINGRLEEATSAICTSTNQAFSEDKLGRTLLHIIALYGDYYTSEASNPYSATSNINKDSDSCAANIAKLLLNDKKVNIKNDILGYNPLDYAIANRSLTIANEICAISHNLNVKVDISQQYVDGNTALHIAAGEGHVHVVSFLISKGANIETVGSNGDTALHKAARNGFEQTVSLLLSAGAQINKRNANYGTPLLCAASKSHVNAVKVLLAGGADIRVLDNFGHTVLHHATAGGSQEIISLLLSEGMEINRQNIENVTPLHLAALTDHVGAVNLLLEKGADVNILDSFGDTALHAAAKGGSPEIISLLVSKGMKINKQNVQNVTPLHRAAAKGHVDAVNFLLTNGADVNILDSFGDTALHAAAKGGSPEIIALLVSKGMKINKQNVQNVTPLHRAAAKGHVDAVNFLLTNGADINVLSIGEGHKKRHLYCCQRVWK